MFLRSVFCVSVLAISTSVGFASQAGDAKAASQNRVAELKASIAKNRAALQQYQWTETTTILLKGEVKKTEKHACHYGPDGKVQKTSLDGGSQQPQQQEQRRGGRLKAKIVEKKVDEMKDYGERLKSLIGEYIPPNPEKMKEAFQAGNTNITPSEGVSAVSFANYYKPGDKLTFSFDDTAKKIRSFAINTYLDDPKTDIVTLNASFASLPDGTNYVSMTDLKAASKNMEIRTVNSDYQKVAP